MTPVLIFGDGIAAYGIIRSLGPRGIPIFMISPDLHRGTAAFSRHVMQHTYINPMRPDCFEMILGWGLKEVGPQAVLMVAGSDSFLDVLSRNLSCLPSGWQATFPSWEHTLQIRDKVLTYEAARGCGLDFPVYWTYLVMPEKSALFQDLAQAPWPMILKPHDSHSFFQKHGRKGFLCQSAEDAWQVLTNTPEFNTGFIIQEFIPGDDTCLVNFIGIYDRESNPLITFVNRKRRVSGEFLSCTLMESHYSEGLVDYSNRLVKAIGYVGYANTECKIDPRDGRMHIMEINGRFSLSNSHALFCGIDVAHSLYTYTLGLPSIANPAPPQIVPAKYWWSPLDDLAGFYRTGTTDWSGLKQFLRTYKRGRTIVEPWCWKDPMPFLASMWRLGRSWLRRTARCNQHEP